MTSPQENYDSQRLADYLPVAAEISTRFRDEVRGTLANKILPEEDKPTFEKQAEQADKAAQACMAADQIIREQRAYIEAKNQGSLQLRTLFWMMGVWRAKFHSIANNARERQFRFAEEALELLQSLGFSREDVNTIADYTYGRPPGEPEQEVGGAMITLAALCNANSIDMDHAATKEMQRISTPEMMEKIRRKHELGESGTPRGYPEAANYVPPAEPDMASLMRTTKVVTHHRGLIDHVPFEFDLAEPIIVIGSPPILSFSFSMPDSTMDVEIKFRRDYGRSMSWHIDQAQKMICMVADDEMLRNQSCSGG